MTEAAQVWVEVPFEVQKPQDGQRVDAFLAARMHRYSRAEIQRIVAEGRVFVRGRAAKPATRVANGDVVIIRYPKTDDPPASVDKLEILYEDEHLLIIDKPAGVLSHPTDKVHANTVTSLLKSMRPDMVPRLAHRLDRETSGVLMLAKDAETAKRLYEAFVARRIKKEYLAVVLGKVEWAKTSVDLPIGREDEEIKVRQKVGEGAEAVTDFERVVAREDLSLVRALPKTGRLHQIRVHLAHLGHPVAGDKLYIGEGAAYMKAVKRELTAEDLTALGADRQLLHAWKLRLKHPVTGEALELVSPLPADFRALFPELG